MSSTDVVMRQTNYTREEAEAQLRACNNDVKTVVRAYLARDMATAAPMATKATGQTDAIYSRIRAEFATQDTRPVSMDLVQQNLQDMEQKRADDKAARDAITK
jgi:hypothetical protein